MGDLEATHARSLLLDVIGCGGAVFSCDRGELGASAANLLVKRAVLGVGNRTGGIFRLDAIVGNFDDRLFAEPCLLPLVLKLFAKPDFEVIIGGEPGGHSLLRSKVSTKPGPIHIRKTELGRRWCTRCQESWLLSSVILLCECSPCRL